MKAQYQKPMARDLGGIGSVASGQWDGPPLPGGPPGFGGSEGDELNVCYSGSVADTVPGCDPTGIGRGGRGHCFTGQIASGAGCGFGQIPGTTACSTGLDPQYFGCTQGLNAAGTCNPGIGPV